MKLPPVLLACAFVGSLSGLLDARAESELVPLRRLAIGELGGWVELTLTIGDRAGRWLLDTGASRNLVSPHLARQLGLSPSGSVRADTLLGQVQGGEIELPPLHVGAFKHSGQRALVIAPQELLGVAAEGIDGVLGVPWLDGVQAELDLRAWTATFRAGGMADCPDGLAAVVLARYRTLPVIAIATGTDRERYVLDTGNPGGLIRVEADAPGATTPGLAIPGNMRLTVLREAALGPHKRTDVPVTRLTSAPLKRALGDAAKGLAGTAFMDGARWQLDLARDRLCVEPGSFATPGGFGLVPVRQGEDLRVQFVLPGSPAAQAGLRVGDTIVRWADLPASRPLAELWQALQGREEIGLAVGEPARKLTLKRSIFAPAAP